MPDYEDLDLTADPTQLRQDARDWITANAPTGFRINRLVDWLLGAVARMAVETVVLAGRVPTFIFQTFGEKVLRIPVLEATSATGTVAVTAVDTAGHTLDAGATFNIDDVGFISTAPATIAAGSTGPVNAPVQAVEPGSGGSGVTGTLVRLDSPNVTWVASTTLTATTVGGVDGETSDEYVNRLPDEIPTLSPKAILISDFEGIARRDAEVFSALAIDNLVPPSTTGVEGAVTVALRAADGTAVSSAAKTRVETALEAGRVLALDVHVIDPAYTQIDVAFTATAHAGWDPVTVKADAEQAVKDFLSPATWGRPDGGDPEAWVDEPTVRRNDLFGVVYAVPGIRHVTALTLAVHGSALGTSDVTLTGPAGLPVPDTVTGTVT